MTTWILGVSALYHDAAVALLRDGEIVAAVQEERFSRLKHDRAMPVRAAQWCLDEAGIEIGDLSALVFYEKPLRKFERLLATTVATFPRSWRLFSRSMRSWLGEKMWIRNVLTSTFRIPADRILFSEHHLSHAASAFLCSPHREAAILTVDGVGEWATTGLWQGSDQAPFIRPLAEIRYPHSLGLLYSSLTAYLGFAVNNGEYKVMGMAPYGRPRFRPQIERLITLDDGGGFELNLDYFAFHHDPERSYSDKLIALLGPPRFPGSPFVPPGTPGDHPAEVLEQSQRYADVAASVQAVTEDVLLHLARHAHKQTGARALCLAGGVALNSVANHRLARDGPFDHIWVQPAAGDAGGALGAALWAWHTVMGNPRGSGSLDSLALGRGWPRERVKRLLDDLRFPYTDLGSAMAAADRVAEDLLAGRVVGWLEGRGEWGPRALGHRSILADPRDARMRDIVNARIKYREPFRPFAPAVLEEEADAWFDIPPAGRGLTPFMLSTAQVREERRAEIPATTHVNGSARVQLVSQRRTPVFHRIIRSFADQGGVPVVLNTSFNLRGECIVGTPIDAVATLLRSELDAIYVQGFRLERPRDNRRRRASRALLQGSDPPSGDPTAPAPEASAPEALPKDPSTA